MAVIDSGADPAAGAAGTATGAEVVGEALVEPSLHAPGGQCDQFHLERAGWFRGEQFAEPAREVIEAGRVMDGDSHAN